MLEPAIRRLLDSLTSLILARDAFLANLELANKWPVCVVELILVRMVYLLEGLTTGFACR